MVMTMAELKRAGGSISRKARLKGKFGKTSTYAQILNCLNKFQDENINQAEKIYYVEHMQILIEDWLRNHTGTNSSTRRRRGALSRLEEQLETIDWVDETFNDLQTLLADEDFNVQDEFTIFRGTNDPLTRKYGEYSKLTGHFYAKSILENIIKRAITKNKINKINCDRHLKFFDASTNRLCQNLTRTRVPREFARGTRIVTDKILREIRSPAAGYISLVNYVFLTLLGPYVTSPSYYHIIPALPGNKISLLVLVFLSKIMQNMANRTTILREIDEDDTTGTLNPTIQKYQPIITAYLINKVYKEAGGGTNTLMDGLLT
jgi:hypothetical protein